MDRIEKFETAILTILKKYENIKYANVDGGNQIIADKENRRYQVVTLGWQDESFVHHCPLHFEIIDNKIWIWQNMTEWDLGKMLEEQGIGKKEIVPGFLSPDSRVYAGYAEA